MSGPPSIPSGRVAGIDFGLKRIGIAVCDASRILASPWAMHEPTGDVDRERSFYRSLADEERLVGFVVGLPLNADGTPSRMSKEAERFGGWLAAATGLPVEFQDERYTSAEAAGKLAGSGLTRGRKKRLSDAIAAQILLADWMARAGSQQA